MEKFLYGTFGFLFGVFTTRLMFINGFKSYTKELYCQCSKALEIVKSKNSNQSKREVK